MLQRRNLLKFCDESTFACWGEHHIGSFRGFCTGDPRPWEKRRGCLSAGKQLDYDFFRHSRTIDGALFYLASAKTPLHAKGPNKALKSSFANSVKSHCACASLCGGIGKGAGWEGSLGREQDGKKPRPWRTNLRIDGRNAPQIVRPNRAPESCARTVRPNRAPKSCAEIDRQNLQIVRQIVRRIVRPNVRRIVRRNFRAVRRIVRRNFRAVRRIVADIKNCFFKKFGRQFGTLSAHKPKNFGTQFGTPAKNFGTHFGTQFGTPAQKFRHTFRHTIRHTFRHTILHTIRHTARLRQPEFRPAIRPGQATRKKAHQQCHQISALKLASKIQRRQNNPQESDKSATKLQ